MLDKAKDGSWGTIAFWNAKQLGDLSMNATQSQGLLGKTITYTLTVKNIGPAPQPFTLTDAIPEGTTFVRGLLQRLHQEHRVEGHGPAHATKTFIFTVKVNPGTPAGTKITNKRTLGDDANGDTATQTVKVGR